MRDLFIKALGDIEIKYLNEVETLSSALVRRISTPPDGYARLVKTEDGFVQLDSNYGSPLYSYLSLPTTELEDDFVLTALQQAVSVDKRIEIVSIKKALTSVNTLSIYITYKASDSQTDELITTVAEINV